MQYWQRNGEYSDLKKDGNNNSTMVRYVSNGRDSTVKTMEVVCEGLTRFSLNIRPSLNSRKSFQEKLAEIGESDTIPGDWNRKVFEDHLGRESTDATMYPPASFIVNIGNNKSVQRLSNVLQATKEFSPDREKNDFDEIEDEMLNNIERMRCKLGKRSRRAFEIG